MRHKFILLLLSSGWHISHHLVFSPQTTAATVVVGVGERRPLPQRRNVRAVRVIVLEGPTDGHVARNVGTYRLVRAERSEPPRVIVRAEGQRLVVGLLLPSGGLIVPHRLVTGRLRDLLDL